MGLMRDITIERLDESRIQDWCQYVARTETSVFSHEIGWKTVVEKTYAHKAYYLIAYRDGEVAGVLPLFFVRSKIFGRFLVTSPFLTFGGILSDDEKIASALVNEGARLAVRKKAKYIETKNSSPCEDLPISVTKYFSLILDLQAGEESIWKTKLHSMTKRNIKKAKKFGVEVLQGLSFVDEYYHINNENMRRLGTPAHSKAFFQNIISAFPDSVLLMAKLNNKFIGGMLLVKHKDTMLMPWTASLPNCLSLRPNNLLYWEAIRLACSTGFKYLDFGRSKWDSGTFRFKSQYGAEPVQLFYQYHLNTARKEPDFDPDSSSFKPLIDIWRILPVGLLNTIGPHIIRNIP